MANVLRGCARTGVGVVSVEPWTGRRGNASSEKRRIHHGHGSVLQAGGYRSKVDAPDRAFA